MGDASWREKEMGVCFPQSPTPCGGVASFTTLMCMHFRCVTEERPAFTDSTVRRELGKVHTCAFTIAGYKMHVHLEIAHGIEEEPCHRRKQVMQKLN